jgi:hypothetical protein
MDLALVLREIRGKFSRQEGARQMGDFQGPLDSVVIGNGHEVHPAFPTETIDIQRFGETFGGSDATEEPFGWAIRVLAVHMEIRFHECLLPFML